MRRFVLITLMFFSLNWSSAQQDSIFLSFNEYISLVYNNHPLIKEANLRLDFAKANWLSARGLLDPSIDSYWDNKEYSDDNYYRKFKVSTRVPTILGLDLIAGYERNEGDFLSAENSTGDQALYNIGFQLDILQGLIVNEKRIRRDQAEIIDELSLAQREKLINEILLSSADAYLKWQRSYNKLLVVAENIELSLSYFENTKNAFENGEMTALDTLEAKLIYQNVDLLASQIRAEYLGAQQNLENFLWEGESALELNSMVYPPKALEEELIPDLTDLDNLINDNPKIRELDNSLKSTEIEQRLKREKLKPKLRAAYNPLLTGRDNNILPSYSISDYKLGVQFSMPFLFRSERADVKMGEIKIAEMDLKLKNEKNILKNSIENGIIQIDQLNRQLNILLNNIEGFRSLLEGEFEKFRFGESSVFLINSRQEKYIQSKFKEIEMRYKLNLKRFEQLYYLNQLPKV